MSYDPTLPTDKDKVRLRIGDTDSGNEFLSDDEINFFLNQEADLLMAAATAARAIAAQVARDTDYRFSTLWKDASQAYKHFKELADDLEAESSITEKSSPAFLHSGDEAPDPIFEVGMDDHD